MASIKDNIDCERDFMKLYHEVVSACGCRTAGTMTFEGKSVVILDDGRRL